ncbi:recombinase RecF [Pontibacter diazotrophicus]|uniref:Recombinase RecF n=1 Tax=Pontibacter diazotrophicus TaxID=1400979 RepID=A0A3D8LF06_9BACT|nr:AAA family ATPase [Pontibacter diazotrophicus]RDV15844.1 recombinase RecF [Pontibacter diazotrophicus]
MKIQQIQIVGVGGIQNLDLNFHNQMNIICGPNGIGKTTALESIAHLFSYGETSILKRNVKAENSLIKIYIQNDTGSLQNHSASFSAFTPEKRTTIQGLHQFSNKLISLKTTRLFGYQPLQSITKDSKKEQSQLFNDAKSGISFTDVKNWFVNRYLYSAHPGALTTEQMNNFVFAKTCFSFLNKDFAFSRVDASSNEIMVNTPSGEIYYEYLSSGFKSILSILFGIIKEIEYRFTEPKLQAKDFNGIILIDELELHLHPEWQGKIISILKKAFPLAQFITTTHSPHVIQAADPNEIIALGFKDNHVIQRELPQTEYGFKGWTVEEVLSDVMGMGNTRTEEFNNLIVRFENSIDSNDYLNARLSFDELNLMLHPHNHLRKLLSFQLAGIKGE